MPVHAKHIATFLLGAAAGFALYKYMNMTDDEKETFMNDLKQKANRFRDEAESAAGKAREYFEELKTKGADAMKEHLAEAEQLIHDLFGKKTPG